MSLAEAKRIDEIVGILRKVPAKRLMIIDLANEIPIENGAFDKEALANLSVDIKLAVQEASIYGAQTIQAVSALTGIRSL